MTRDFTLDKYSELMLSLKGNYAMVTVAQYIERKFTGPVGIRQVPGQGNKGMPGARPRGRLPFLVFA